jgi:hypothetical protein
MEENWDLVVVTIKGWDGSRVLGAFDDLDSAKKNVGSYLTGLDYRDEEVAFDFVCFNTISSSMRVEFNCDQDLNKFESSFRYHSDS